MQKRDIHMHKEGGFALRFIIARRVCSLSREYLIHFSPRDTLENTFGIEIITYVRDKKERDQECRQCKTEAEIHHRRNNHDTDHDEISRQDILATY